jgi:hypothetical protein
MPDMHAEQERYSLKFSRELKYKQKYVPRTAKYSIKYLFQVRVLCTGLFSLAFSCCCYSDLNAFIYSSTLLSLDYSFKAALKIDGLFLQSTIH